MSANVSHASGVAQPAKAPLSGKTKTGYVLAVILGLGDLANLATIGQDLAPGQEGPPAGVTIVTALLGLITIVATVIAWRARSRPAVRVLVGARVLSLILGLPAFFVSGVPALAVVATAVFVVVTLVCLMLVLAKPKDGAPSTVAGANSARVSS